MKFNTNSNVYIIIYSVVMVVVVAVLLTLAAVGLKDRQDANILNEKKTQIVKALGDGTKEYKDVVAESVLLDANGNVVESEEAKVFEALQDVKGSREAGKFPLFKAKDGSVVVPLYGKGLWGPIWGYIALDKNMNTVKGIVLDHQGETPGLGAEIATDKHQAMYKGKRIFEGEKLVGVTLKKGGAKDPKHEVDAITGGTKTSEGVSNMIKDCLVSYKPYFAAEKPEGKVTKGDPKTMDTLSYCVGANIGTGVRMQFAEFNLDVKSLKGGIVNGLLEKSSAEDAFNTLNTFFRETLNDRRADFQALREHDSTAVFVPFADAEENAKISTALGVDIGSNMLKSPYDIQYYWLLEGLQNATDEDVKLSDEAMQEFMRRYHTVVLPKKAAERSEKWLAEKAKESGVNKTESGLLYKVVEAGDMEKATKNDADVVKVHYVGKLQDGTVFDASRFADKFTAEQIAQFREQYPDMFDENGNFKQADQPAEFPLNGVIKGWTEGMKLIGPGGKIVLYIPADLAYGAQGAGRQIGPNEALEFTVELLEVTPAPVENMSNEVNTDNNGK